MVVEKKKKKQKRSRGRGALASKRLALFLHDQYQRDGKKYFSPRVNLSSKLLKELGWADKTLLEVRKTKFGISLRPVELTYEEAKELGREEWEESQ